MLQPLVFPLVSIHWVYRTLPAAFKQFPTRKIDAPRHTFICLFWFYSWYQHHVSHNPSNNSTAVTEGEGDSPGGTSRCLQESREGLHTPILPQYITRPSLIARYSILLTILCRLCWAYQWWFYLPQNHYHRLRHRHSVDHLRVYEPCIFPFGQLRQSRRAETVSLITPTN